MTPQRVPVSVLMPVRNESRHLPEAINSLSEQTFSEFEVIVVDDGSVDATPEILADWRRRDRRVRVIRQEPTGITQALKRASAETRGDLLARMDADDVASRDRLERQVELISRRPSPALVGCLVRYIPREALRAGALRYEGWLNRCESHTEIEREAFVECPIAHPTFLVRADAFRAVGGYRDRPWPEDYDLFLRLLRAGAQFAKVPEVLLKWREGPGRLSRNDPRYSQKAFARCKAHHLVRHYPQLASRPVVVWGAGPTGKRFVGELTKRGISTTAFAEVHPRRIGEVIRGARVLDSATAVTVRDAFHLAAVAQPGARQRIRESLAGAGLRELRDYVAVA